MKSRTFFARLWRWNALVIFVAGMLAIALLVTAIVAELFDENVNDDVVNVAADEVMRSETRLGDFARIDGSDVLRAPLHLEQEVSGSFSKETSSVQNYLHYDPSTSASYWLVRGPATLFASAKELPSRDYDDEGVPVVAFVYEQVSRDTNGDRRLMSDDLKTIALSDAAGKRFTPVLRNVTQLHAAELVKDGTIVIVYTTSAKLRAASIDLGTFRVIRETAVEAK